jgi:hypothetical protein
MAALAGKCPSISFTPLPERRHDLCHYLHRPDRGLLDSLANRHLKASRLRHFDWPFALLSVFLGIALANDFATYHTDLPSPMAHIRRCHISYSGPCVSPSPQPHLHRSSVSQSHKTLLTNPPSELPILLAEHRFLRLPPRTNP